MGNTSNTPQQLNTRTITSFTENFFKKNFFFKKRYSTFLNRAQTFLQYSLNRKECDMGWKSCIDTLKTRAIGIAAGKSASVLSSNALNSLNQQPNLYNNWPRRVRPQIKYPIVPYKKLKYITRVLKYTDHMLFCKHADPILPALLKRKACILKKILTPTACILVNSLNSKNMRIPASHISPLMPKVVSGQNFIFKNIGIFIVNNLTNTLYVKSDLIKFKVKKKLFSFIFPNEVKNNFLKFKKTITFYNIVYKANYMYAKNTNSPYEINNLSDLNIRFFKNLEIVSLLFKNKMGNFFSKQSTPAYSTAINYLNNSKTLNVLESFGKNNSDNSFRTTEVRIPRIRFRPGYQRLWRQARHALKESLGANFTYQQQLTRYLVKFFKWVNLYSFSKNELALSKVAMYSQLIPDMETFNLFIINKLLYINGLSTFNKNFILTPGDSIQIIISK